MRKAGLAYTALGGWIAAVLWSAWWPPIDPRRNYAGWVAFGFVLYFVCPAAWLRLTGRKIQDYGMSLRRPLQLVKWLAAGLPVALVAAGIAARNPAIANYYPLSPAARSGGAHFAGYIAASLVYLFAWEFVFRGYLTFTLFRALGWPGVVVEAFVFGLAHWGKPPVEVASAFFGSAVQGVIALRTGSLAVPFLLHTVLFVALNSLVLK